MNVINENIVRLLEETGMSQLDLAKKLVTDDSKLDSKVVTINRWVNGVVTPSLKTIETLCAELDLPKSYFLDSHKENLSIHYWNDLANIEAINRFLSVFSMSVEEDTDDFFYIVNEKNEKISPKYTQGDFSTILYDINKYINDKLFYQHPINYLHKKDLTNIPKYEKGKVKRVRTPEEY